MTTYLIDYAWAQIPAPNIKEAGYIAAIRYLGGSARLTPVERDNLFAAGLGISLVWETAADEADHPERGASDAQRAEAEADGLGYPADCPIFYADDQNDPDVSQELRYFDAVANNARRPVGVYGGGNVVKACMDAGSAAYGWRVETWYPNAGAVAHVIQLANSKRPFIRDTSPDSYDVNTLERPYPIWGLHPEPEPTEPNTVGDNRMWCASILNLEWVDVWYMGIIVDSFHNEGPFGIGDQLRWYMNQGVPVTVYKTENDYKTPRLQLGQMSGVLPKKP